MPLYKHIRDDVNKLTYIERTDFSKAKFTMFYKSNGVLKRKTLPYRASKEQLLSALKYIREDSDYYIEEAKKYASGQYDIKNKNLVIASSVEGETK